MLKLATTNATTRRCLLAMLCLAMLFITPSAIAQQPDDAPSSTDPGATTEQPEETARQRARDQLANVYGYDDETLGNMQALVLSQGNLAAQVKRDLDDITALEGDLTRATVKIELLEEQLAEPRQNRRARRRLSQRLGESHAKRLLHAAQIEADQIDIADVQRETTLLATYIKGINAAEEDRQRDALAAKLAEEKRLREEAERRAREEEIKKKEQQELDQIKKQKERAKTKQLETLYAEHEELQKAVLAKTPRRLEIETELAKEREEKNSAFIKRRDELVVFVEQLPEELQENKRKSTVDPVFHSVWLDRRADRSTYFERFNALQRALQTSDEAHTGLADAQDKLQEAKVQLERGETEHSTARVARAETLVKLRTIEAEIADLELEHHDAMLELKLERLEFYEREIELLLPYISSSKRDEFYRLTSDANWQDTRHGLQLALVRITRHIQQRTSQAIDILSDPFSIALWAFVGGLLVRLFFVLIAVVVARSRGPRWIQRLTKEALKRRFFRQRPSATIKGGEVLRHILGPATIFLGITYILSYGQTILPELKYVQWVVNAVIIFRITTVAVSVMLLPRTLREPHKVLEESYDTDEHDNDGIDVFELEINRARKLVRSAKVVIWFWLIYIYIPELVVALMGHSIVWRVIDIATTWGFIIVIYSVLSTWKNDIAVLFERLAAERLPRAVQFVNENKDRVWGVLVIGGASLYVIVTEGIRLGRRYLVETEWSKRINNFIFRKTIEYQRRDQSRPDDDEATTLMIESLPANYKQLFEDHPITEEAYIVERNDHMDDMIAAFYQSWRKHRKQGSIALTGESGAGKSTQLNQIARQFEPTCDAVGVEIAVTRIVDKITSDLDVLEFVADLFELSNAPTTKHELIDILLEMNEHMLIIDDCHHMFVRRISGFAGLELFLEIVNLTDHKHFWVLSFEHYAWSYLTRIKRREHYFGKILPLASWTESEIEDLIARRNLMTGYTCSFTNLVVTRDEGEDVSYEVIKSSRGYFRLLHEFCQGNPRVALTYWLRSLEPGEEDDTLQVGLFKMPPRHATLALDDAYWFTLTALAQHTALDAHEISLITNTEIGFCEMALNYFSEKDVVFIDEANRARLSSLYIRQVLRHLIDSNYLYD